ncbi:MAG TPA: hypothetical protein VKB57_28355 [Acidimicrobiales bacterium]|nr:hypothetical protein [Acidimicrobiales bacterium]
MAAALALVVVGLQVVPVLAAPPPPPNAAPVGNRLGLVSSPDDSTVNLRAGITDLEPGTGGGGPTSTAGGEGGPCAGAAFVSGKVAIPDGNVGLGLPASLSDADVAAGRVSSFTPNGYYARYCPNGDGTWRLDRVFQFAPGPDAQAAAPVVPADVVARLAVGQIRPPTPRPATAPRIGLSTIVGISTWMWVDTTQWRPITRTASVGPVGVTATVTPATVTWDMGEGHGKQPAVCDGPGRMYQLDVPDDLQHTDCAYVFQWASTDHRHDDHVGDSYHATATITWTVAWRTVDGSQTGSLADLHTTTPFDIRVNEIQPVVCYDTPVGQCDAG